MPPATAAGSADPAVYAIADTHLGLREAGRGGHRDQPLMVAGFLRWLHGLPAEGLDLPWWDGARVRPRRLGRPTHTILLGDAVELWDAENQAVLLSAASVAEPLRSVPGSKVHVVGNHDNVMGALAGSYPLGSPPLDIVGDVFPPRDENGKVTPLRIGSRSYLFVHGHQFDTQFMRVQGAWALLGHLRQFGAALGAWSWVFGGLAAVVLLAQLVAPTPLGWGLFAALVAAWFPRFYMKTARRLWGMLAGTRYDRRGTLEGFEAWWRRFRSEVVPADDLGVVYGHTHYLDWLEAGQAEAGVDEAGGSAPEARLLGLLGQERARTALFNVSAWVATEGSHKDVVMATIFYADETGPAFLGWDWREGRPFHIPFAFLRNRRLGRRMDAVEAKVARELLWPDRLVRKWQATSEDVSTRERRRGQRT
jgi:hypothetical protein